MNRTLSTTRHAPAATGILRALGRGVLALHETWSTWYERARQRRALDGLSDHLLHDIGLSRADAYREAHKPFWRE